MSAGTAPALKTLGRPPCNVLADRGERVAKVLWTLFMLHPHPAPQTLSILD